MKLLPGHQKRLWDMFEFLDTIYPRENAKEDIALKTMYNQQIKKMDTQGLKRLTSAKNNRPIHHKSKSKKKTLLKQYESLDYETRENFNKKFITELESKGGIAIG